MRRQRRKKITQKGKHGVYSYYTNCEIYSNVELAFHADYFYGNFYRVTRFLPYQMLQTAKGHFQEIIWHFINSILTLKLIVEIVNKSDISIKKDILKLQFENIGLTNSVSHNLSEIFRLGKRIPHLDFFMSRRALLKQCQL